jgi:hypothetical protein
MLPQPTLPDEVHARKVTEIMVRYFRATGATWTALRDASGLSESTYLRGLTWAIARKWIVGGGAKGQRYYLNPEEGNWVDAANSGTIRNKSLEVISGGNPGGNGHFGGNPGGNLGGNLTKERADRLICLIDAAIKHAGGQKKH